MKTIDAMKTLMDWDNRGRAVFTVEDLRAIFPERTGTALSQGLRRLVRSGVLEHVARGVYVNPLARSRTHVLEQIAVTLRRGNTSYQSLESALGHYSIISQQTIACVTVMTTGRKGRFDTPYGTCLSRTQSAPSTRFWTAPWMSAIRYGWLTHAWRWRIFGASVAIWTSWTRRSSTKSKKRWGWRRDTGRSWGPLTTSRERGRL